MDGGSQKNHKLAYHELAFGQNIAIYPREAHVVENVVDVSLIVFKSTRSVISIISSTRTSLFSVQIRARILVRDDKS
jgi:hypothetical protein